MSALSLRTIYPRSDEFQLLFSLKWELPTLAWRFLLSLSPVVDVFSMKLSSATIFTDVILVDFAGVELFRDLGSGLESHANHLPS